VIGGVRIVRGGKQWTVHLDAFRRYRGRLKGRFDLVIDEVNTIPFFTPLWAGVPTCMMIWQLAREVWWYESRFPLSAIGFVLEPIYLRAYRNTSVFTFSESTVADLRKLGLRGQITLIPIGIEPAHIPESPKSREPSFIYVGRLAPSKRVHEIVEAFALFRLKQGCGRLLLVGNGSEPYVRRLVRLAVNLGVSDSVEYCGWLRGPAKHHRMAEAHALLMASVREGWGLVVTECNSCGTPAVVYDVPGLRDSVRHLQTGLVVRPSPGSMAEGMRQLTGDPDLYQRLRDEAHRWSLTFTYEAGSRIIRERIAVLASATAKRDAHYESEEHPPPATRGGSKRHEGEPRS
jgi:glycosyltransferase involved in cell wall biosynthesis